MKKLTDLVGKQGEKPRGRLRELRHIVVLSLLPLPCFAGTNVSPESILRNIIDYLSGDLALTVGALVVIGSGYAFLGKQAIEKQTFIRIIIGMGLILGGATLADYFWGSA